MADSVDDRVVAMKFDNAAFEAKIQQTLTSLGQLQKSLDLSNTTKGLANINTAPATESLSHMAAAVDNIGSKFSAVGVIAITTLANITTKLENAALNFAKGFTLGPITDGFHEMETKVGSIQTILANTSRYGTGLDEVSANLQELNAYSDRTIYNFGEMTKNIGLFTNAGIKVGDATQMIKGFSNVAAASGTTAEGAAGAAYQLSQGLSAGKIALMDWRSLTNVGMGNANMKSGIIDIANAMGTLKSHSVDMKEVQTDFNSTLEKGWLTADVMSNYLRIMAGDMDATKMKALGLSAAQIATFTQQQKTAEDAATKVRTFTQLVGTIKESIGSGWSETFELIFGNFETATELFTGINNAVGGFVGTMSDARNAILKTWSDFGARTALIEAFKDVFFSLGQIVDGLRMAFGGLFPAPTGEQLIILTAGFVKLTEALRELIDKNLAKFVYVFAAVSTTIKIAFEIIKGITTLFVNLFKALVPDKQGANALGFFGMLGRALFEVNTAILNSVLPKFFGTLNKGIVPLARLLGNLTGKIIDFFFSFKYSEFIPDVSTQLTALSAGLSNVGDIVKQLFDVLFRGDFTGGPLSEDSKIIDVLFKIRDAIGDVIGIAEQFFFVLFARDFKGGPLSEDSKIIDVLFKIRDAFAKVGDVVKSVDYIGILQSLGDVLVALKDKIVDFFSFGADTDKVDKVSDSLKNLSDRTELFYTTISSKNLGDPISSIFGGSAGGGNWEEKASGIKGFFQTIQDYFASFIDTIQTYIGNIRDAGGSIKDAIGKFFTGSDVVSTQSTFEAVVTVIKSILVTGILFEIYRFVQEFKKLVGSAKGIFTELGGILKNFGEESNSTKLIKIAVALVLLATALKKIADIPKEDLKTAFAAMAAGLVTLMAALKVMDKGIKGGAGLKSTATSMILVAVALRAMADAVKVFASMDIEELKKGLASATIGLVALGASMNLIRTSVSPGTAIVVLGMAGALFIVAKALEMFIKFEPGELAKGILAMSVAMVAIGVAVGQMGPSSILAAPAIFIVALSLGKIADAIERFAAIKAGDLAKGIFSIGVALDMITGTMRRLGPEAILGAAGIAIVALSLGKIVDAIQDLGEMKGSTLRQGLVGMALGLAAIALAVNAMEGALAGAAALVVVSFAIGLLVDAIIKLGEADLKTIGVGIGALVVAFLLLAAAGAFLSPFILALGAAMLVLGAGMLLFGAGVWLTVKAFEVLVGAANENTNTVIAVLERLAEAIPHIFAVFIENIAKATKDIEKSSKQIFEAIANIVISALDAMLSVIPKVGEVVNAITSEILKFIGDRLVDFVDMGFKILLALGEGLFNNVGELTILGIKIIVKFLETLADQAYLLIEAGVNLILALITGLGAKMGAIVDRGGDLIIYLMAGIAAKTLEVIAAAGAILIAFLDGVAAWIRDNDQKIHESGANLANAIVEGMLTAIVGEKNAQKVIDAIKKLAGSAIDAFKSAFGIGSPSKVIADLTKRLPEGMVLALDQDTTAKNAIVRHAEGIVKAFEKTLSKTSEGLPGIDTHPVITPVLDLTQVTAASKNLNDLMSVSDLSPKVSLDQARLISTTEPTNQPDDASQNGSGPTHVTFEQNNYSPTSLSTNDVYRNTKSQIALAKEELGIK